MKQKKAAIKKQMDSELASKTNGGKYIPKINKHSNMISGRSGKADKRLFENLSKDNRRKAKVDITSEEHDYRKHKEHLRSKP